MVYVRGNTKNRQGESANPGLLDEDTDQAIFIHSLNKSKKIKISKGSRPSISHDGSTIAFVKEGQIWTASLNDSIPQPKKVIQYSWISI